MLRNSGCSVGWAIDGAKAVEEVRTGRYNLVIMDCHMPVMDGFEASRVIRNLPGEQAQIPIIALTADAMEGDRQRCLAAGMNDYLSKPIDYKLLVTKLDDWAARIRDLHGKGGEEDSASREFNREEDSGRIAIPGLDFAALLMRCMGDLRLARRLIALFAQQAPGYLAELEEVAASGDCISIAKAAHKIKGAAASIDLETVRAEAERLELEARRNVWNDDGEVLTPLKTAVDEFLEASKGVLDGEGSAGCV